MLNLVIFSLLFWSQVLAQYEPTWESLDSRPIPTWYDNAKFGIFIHWGVYSVPGAASEGFWIDWKNGDENLESFVNRTQASNFTYQTYAHQFTAEFFNATQWASLFKQSGAKYVVLTAKHADGYTLWPSSRAFSWNSVDVGPHIDIVKELSNAVKKEEMKFGVYYFFFEWFNRMYLADMAANYTTNDYVTDKMLPEMRELVTNYGVSLFRTYGDWMASEDYWHSKEFLTWLFNESPVKDEVVTTDHWGVGTLCNHGGVSTCSPDILKRLKWEHDISMDNYNKSFGFRKTMTANDVLSTESIIKELVETVSRGGNFLLNVGPTMEGTIPPIFEERLLSLGEWLNINGEAIYETKLWKYYKDLSNNDVWYTASRKEEDVIYGILLKWPQEGFVTIRSVPLTLSSVNILGFDEPLIWKTDIPNGYTFIKLPNIVLMPSKLAWTMKMKLR